VCVCDIRLTVIYIEHLVGVHIFYIKITMMIRSVYPFVNAGGFR